MALLFLISAGSAERDAVLAAAPDATALLALGDRVAVVETDDLRAADLAALPAVQAAVEAAAAVGVADGVDALFDDRPAALSAVSGLLGIDPAALDEGVVGEALGWLTAISTPFVAETSPPPGDGEPWDFGGSCETDQLPADAPLTTSRLRAARFAGDAVLEQCLLGGHRMQEPEEGRAVLRVQAALIDLGFSLHPRGADGVFGIETGRAVTAFKQANGIEPSDAVVGPKTIARLDELLAGPVDADVLAPPVVLAPPSGVRPAHGDRPPVGRGQTLGEELVAGSLGFAQDRLAELADAALGDVTSFARAARVDNFVDNGFVDGRLTTARTELDLVATDLGASDFPGAALHLGNAIRAIGEAADAVGGQRLRELLVSTVAWAGVTPKGFAQQLGLPASVPSKLQIEDGAFVYELRAPAASLAPAPLALGFDEATLTARLRVDGKAPAFSIALALTGIEAGVGGGPISSLLGSAAGSAQADVVVGVDTTNGLTLSGGAAKRVVLPARPKLGPLDLREISLQVPSDRSDTIDIGSTITADLGGVIKATVDGSGIRVRIDANAAVSGANPLSVGLKEPTGIGLSLDASLVRGGGFLGKRSAGYGGALQLRLGPVEVKAVGLLTVEPSFALVVVMSIEFFPPIDLSFGFTLNAVGGVVGIEHRLDSDALRDSFASGALDHILFPPDPVAAAPAILDTLEQVFPIDPGSVVIGPMVEVGWGRPVSFLTAQLGVIVSLPDPKIVIIGRVRIALPAPQLPIVDLRATVYGEITPDHLLIRVSLNGSRLAGFSLAGDIGMLLRWGGSAEFAISAGGFHPRYDPPRELAGMQRLSMDISPPAILTLRSESYFALTSNSVQLGSRTEMGADIAVASISGHFEFDALIVFSPHFLFMIDLGIGLTVRVMGVTLCGVSIQLHVEGPGPWRAEGHADVEILWTTIGVDVGPFTWGDDDNPPPADADPRQLARDALHRNPGAWQAVVPPDADRVVKLRSPAPSETDVTVHPIGMFEVLQHAIPLETVIVRVGPNPVPEGHRRVHLGVPLVTDTPPPGAPPGVATPAGALSEVKDLFSAGNFLDLTDDQKLSRPGFEPMPAGARIRPPGEEAPYAASRHAELRYETFVCDDDTMIGVSTQALLTDRMFATSGSLALASGAAGATELRATSRYATGPDPIVLAHPGEVMRVSKGTLASTDGRQTQTYTHAAEELLGTDVQLVRLGVA